MEETAIPSARVLIVDDESSVRGLLLAILGEKHDCSEASSAEEAITSLEKNTFDLVISDVNMGGMSGIDLIDFVRGSSPDTVVMMISGNKTIDSPIEALRRGAFDFIRKPFDIDEVEIAVSRGIEHSALRASKRRHESDLEEMIEERTSRLNYLAYHDSLTGLSNRVFVEDSLAKTLSTAGGSPSAAVLLVSLDNYAAVRDTLGYSVGDGLIREVANRLASVANSSARPARFEGDEFALMVDGHSQEELASLAEQVSHMFESPFKIRENEVYVSASVGISISPGDGSDAATLLKNASAALSHARKLGGDNYQFYSAQIDAIVLRRVELENNLRHALERNELDIFYQPKIDFVTGRIVGMEALLRWERSELGQVTPDQFISVAEETGLIVAISEWVLRTACSQTKEWLGRGFDLQLAANLSPRQFQQADLVERILKIVDEAGLSPRCLNLEVTEGSILNNGDPAIGILRELREAGVSISIDDFGTGYSSLGYLKNLPIDCLKIDKTFIMDVTENPDDAALVMAIMTLAHNLGLKVIAEGVETEEQLKFLRLLKCDEWQGFLCSKAIPAVAFEALLDGFVGVAGRGSKTSFVSKSV